MRLTKGVVGNLKKRYLAVLKKCRLLNMFGVLALASLLYAGGAQAITLTTADEWNKAVDAYLAGGSPQDIIFNGSNTGLVLKTRFDTGDLTLHSATLEISNSARLDTDAVIIEGGSVLNANAVYVAGDGTSYVNQGFSGLVVDSNLTVGKSGTAAGKVSGTINTSYLDVQTYDTSANAPDSAKLTIDAGGRVNVSGDVNVQKFANGADAEIIIKDNGHLRVGGELKLVNGGKISVDGQGGSIYLENNATLDVTTISSDTTKDGIVLTNQGQVYGKKRLTLTGGTKLDAAQGNVKAAFMTIGDGTDDLEVTGEFKVYGKASADDSTPFDQVLLAGTMSTSGSGQIVLGDATTPTNVGAGNYGGTTTAKFVTAGTGGLSVEGGTWTVGDVTIGAGTKLNINNGTLDVSGSTLTTDASSTVATTATGTLKIKSADVTISGSALDTTNSSIKIQINNAEFVFIVY